MGIGVAGPKKGMFGGETMNKPKPGMTNQGRKSPPRGKSGLSPARKAGGITRAKVAIALIVTIILVWALWPSPFSRVRNLDSRGSEIIAFGDSLTAGYGAASGEDYPARLAGRTGIAIVNAGLSGDTTASAMSRVDGDVLSKSPRILIVGLGGNDYLQGVPIASTETNLRSIVLKFQGAGAMVVLLGFTFPSFNANYEAMYDRVAREEKCLLIPQVLKGILNNPSLKSDEIHPNGGGYDLMAQRVAGPLQGLLRKANSKR